MGGFFGVNQALHFPGYVLFFPFPRFRSLSLFTAYGSLVQLFKHKNDGKFFTKQQKIPKWLVGMLN